MALPHTTTLRFILDTDTVTPDAGDLESYLIGILDGHDDVLLLRYSDNGPPETELHHNDFSPTGRHAPGWLVIDPVHDHSDNHFWNTVVASAAYTYADDQITRMGVHGGDLLEVPLHYSLRQLQDPTAEQQAQLRRDLILQRAVEAIHETFLVTNRAILLDPIPGLPDLPHGRHTLGPAAALVFVGHWLRAKGEYILQAGTRSTLRTDRVAFYSLATESLVPAGWRWSRNFSQTAPSEQRHLRQLQASQSSRIAAALKARDRSWAAGLSMSTSDAQEEAIECVVDVAMNLMGAYDATAQMVELISPTETPLRNSKWQFENWTKKQGKRLPDLLATFGRHQSIFDIIRILRNTIHGRCMEGLLVKYPPIARPDEFYLALPEEQTGGLRRAFEGSGGFLQWKVQELFTGHLQADPDFLIQNMILQAATALNEMMNATPVAQLLKLSTEPSANPPDEGLFNERNRTNARRQIGL